MKKIESSQQGNGGSQGPENKGTSASPLSGCLAVWLSLLCCVGAIVAGYFGRWMLAGGALAIALVFWLLKGKPDPGLIEEFSERYGVDRSDDPSRAKKPSS